MSRGNPVSVAIVGAGPAGLSAGRALLAHGIPFTIFEKHSGAGGVWDMENPGTPMYRSAHFISSKTMSGFKGYPMPDAYPDYPTNRQLLAYIRAFARDQGLDPHIRFSSRVEKAERLENGWRVRLADGSLHEFTHLVAAPGTNWAPNRAEVPGTLDGEVIHSVDYKDAGQLKGKRVLIVGAGNSGADIACDAARAADAAFISMRRGYHFIPKHILGMPADVFATTGPKLPLWAQQRIFALLLRLLYGDQSRLGLPKPDHKLFETHPLLNDQILHHLRHGDISVRPDVERFEGRDVVFKDGSREAIDLVILATGYHWPIPFIDRELLQWQDQRPELYLNVFAPKDERLFIMGFLESNGGVYGFLSETADLIACAIVAERDDAAGHSRLRALAAAAQPDLSGGIKLVKSPRHAHYIDMDAYRKQMKQLRAKMGWQAA